MGPSIKVWDPYNVLAPPPLPPPPPTVSFGRSYSSDGMLVMEDERERDRGSVMMEVYLISNGESEMSLRPDFINGRSPHAALTTNGKRQARALAVFLNSQGVRFNAVYTSPFDRAKSTAISVCQVSSSVIFDANKIFCCIIKLIVGFVCISFSIIVVCILVKTSFCLYDDLS